MQNVPQHGMPAQQYGNTYGNQRGHGPMGIGNPNSAMTTMGNMGMGSMGGGMNGMNPMNSMANMGMMGQNGGMHGNMMGGMGPGSMGPGSMGPGSMPMNKMGMQVRHSHTITLVMLCSHWRYRFVSGIKKSCLVWQFQVY